jgi:hypothetical protein
MDRQNVTISLPSDLVREVRHLAVDEGVSLSQYVATLLEERVARRRSYNEARLRQQALLDQGLPLGTNGVIGWTRESLHER